MLQLKKWRQSSSPVNDKYEESKSIDAGVQDQDVASSTIKTIIEVNEDEEKQSQPGLSEAKDQYKASIS